MKKLVLFLAVYLFIFLGGQDAEAQQRASASSARLASDFQQARPDYRIQTLSSYLRDQASPLAPYAGYFVYTADKYGLDWKFVAAIAGLESGFGVQIPYNSYNAWGWGVYADKVTRFSSWEEGIDTVSKGLRENYIDKGTADIYSIGKMYASSPTWAQRVTGYMSSIEGYQQAEALLALPIAY